MMPKMPQMDLIAELKKRQVKPQVREGKDGALEDIITGTAMWSFLEESHGDILSMCAACSMFTSCWNPPVFALPQIWETHHSGGQMVDGQHSARTLKQFLVKDFLQTGITHTNKRTCFKVFCIYSISKYIISHMAVCIFACILVWICCVNRI